MSRYCRDQWMRLEWRDDIVRESVGVLALKRVSFILSETTKSRM